MTAATDTVIPQERVIGKIEQGESPVLVVIGGMHGNEHAGIQAIRNVLKSITEQQIPLKGTFYGILGNSQAVSDQKRFIDQDLNRIWDFDHYRQNGQQIYELKERKGLHQFLKQTVTQTNRLFVVDLHTTSSSSAPFFILGDTIRNRAFAKDLPVPKVLGIEEQIGGTMSAYLNERGVVAINFEAGHHSDPDSIKRHEAAIWIALVSSGCLTEAQVPELAGMKKLLKRATRRLPMVFESVFRYGIAPNERFVMRRGFYNFKRVKRGEHLAYSNGSPLFTPKSGRIFMPLYQEQGDDGFFIIKRISPFWLRISEKLRTLDPEKWLTKLPGVSNDPAYSGTLRVNKRIARLYPLKFFHLFGFRKFDERDDVLYVTRRNYDLEPPEKIEL